MRWCVVNLTSQVCGVCRIWFVADTSNASIYGAFDNKLQKLEDALRETGRQGRQGRQGTQ